jgi:5-methyltetrahydrofolate--homocysteine methyltransferase
MRDEFYAGLEDRKYVTLIEAQRRAFKADWTDPALAPVPPKKEGTTVFLDFPIEDVVEYIDWNPFFQVSGWVQGGAA